MSLRMKGIGTHWKRPTVLCESEIRASSSMEKSGR